jgi:hypothetical protein
LPVVDALASEYSDRVAFVAPAWKASFDDTAQQAAQLLPSGTVQWGLDAEQGIFEQYGVPYQPATVLIGADGTVVESWLGARDEAAMRASIEALLQS